VLAVEEIDVYYADLQALWNVSLEVSAGEVVALIGSNGAGKSTLLRAIMGLLTPAKGSVRLNRAIISKLSTHKIVEAGVSMVPEGRGLFPRMTVFENLEMGSFLARARQKQSYTIEWIYEIFPVLRERTNQTAGSLSGGQQQMLAIAKGLMSRPQFVLLDEISSGLAPVLVKQILRVVDEIRKQGMGVILVEQNVFLALQIADRGYVLENGRIGVSGDAAFLKQSGRVKEAYLGQGSEVVS
jgi:branched-chain amino acid transport system ATP-binding protein